MAARDQVVEEAKASIRRVQELDSTSVARTDELGSRFTFEPAVPHLERVIDLFRQLPLDLLNDLSTNSLKMVRQAADAQYQRIEQMLTFDPAGPNPTQQRDGLLNYYRDQAYDQAFDALNPAISFAVRRSVDFEKLDREARAAAQAAKDQAAELLKQLLQRQTEAEAALEAIRQASAEAGVSQQASYFKTQADGHEREAETWLRYALVAATLLAVVATASFFVPVDDAVHAVQLTLTKVFALGSLGYLVVLCTRTFQAQKHNAVVNRHRENGLKTYKALVEAAGDAANRDIVLNRAADCIFAPQPSGFASTKEQEASVSSMVSLGQAATRPTSMGS
jgi:hypothetical protein